MGRYGEMRLELFDGLPSLSIELFIPRQEPMFVGTRRLQSSTSFGLTKKVQSSP